MYAPCVASVGFKFAHDDAQDDAHITKGTEDGHYKIVICISISDIPLHIASRFWTCSPLQDVRTN